MISGRVLDVSCVFQLFDPDLSNPKLDNRRNLPRAGNADLSFGLDVNVMEQVSGG